MNNCFIKNIIEKIKLWFKNFFKKQKKKKKIINKTMNNNKSNKRFINQIQIENTNKSTSINTIYKKINKNDFNTLNNKLIILKNKIEKGNNYKNIQITKDINKLLTNNDIYINQYDNIIDLIDKTNNKINTSDHLTTNEQLNILKDNISQVIDEKLTQYEKDTIKKAYMKYDIVNYITMTTLMIDDINESINEIKNNYNKNKYTIIEYEQQINQIKDKIKQIELIYDKKEVGEEILSLKHDFYTKSKDKYDLLYNKEIFVNLNKQCDNLLYTIKKHENIKELSKKEDLQQKKETKKDIERVKKEKKSEKENLKDKIFIDNIMKRFLDLNLANNIIINREKNILIPNNFNDFINQIYNSYNEFLIGETHVFNFNRNKQKTEIVKLYNDLTRNISFLDKSEYFPLEHINIPLIDITESAIEKQLYLHTLIEKNTNLNLEDNDLTKQTINKLSLIIENEKKKNNMNNKKLVKDINKKTL